MNEKLLEDRRKRLEKGEIQEIKRQEEEGCKWALKQRIIKRKVSRDKGRGERHRREGTVNSGNFNEGSKED